MTVLSAVMILAAAFPGSGDKPQVRSQNPVYELTLPEGYMPVPSPQPPLRYLRPCGREIWSHVTVTFVDAVQELPQDPSGLQTEAIVKCIPLPPDAKWTFAPVSWKDFEIGAVEYRAVVKDLPVLGLAAVVPLMGGTVTVMVSAPETLEKECREDFPKILSGFTKAPTRWHSAEYYAKVKSMDRVAIGGLVLLAIYPIGWALLFRGEPLRLHWLRTGWMAVTALVLFIPVSSPGEATLFSNLVVNGVLPMILLLFAARRIKLGIEEG